MPNRTPVAAPVDWNSPERQRLVAIDRRVAELKEQLHLPPAPARQKAPLMHPFQEDAKRFSEQLASGNKEWQKARVFSRCKSPLTPDEMSRSAVNMLTDVVTSYQVISPDGGVSIFPPPHAATPAPLQLQSPPTPPPAAGRRSSTDSDKPAAAPRFRGNATELTLKPWKVPKVDKSKVKDHYLRAHGLHRNNLALYSDLAKNMFDHNKFYGKPSVDFDFKFTDFVT